MSKDYFVLRGGKVVYLPGHYDVEGARAAARSESRAHPRASVFVVHVVGQYLGVPQNVKGKTK